MKNFFRTLYRVVVPPSLKRRKQLAQKTLDLCRKGEIAPAGSSYGVHSPCVLTSLAIANGAPADDELGYRNFVPSLPFTKKQLSYMEAAFEGDRSGAWAGDIEEKDSAVFNSYPRKSVDERRTAILEQVAQYGFFDYKRINLN